MLRVVETSRARSALPVAAGGASGTRLNEFHTPILGTNSFNPSNPSPNQRADTHEQYQQLTNLKNYEQTNQNLLDRRFFGAAPRPTELPSGLPMPSTTGWYSAALLQPSHSLAGEKIFSRTFDLINGQRNMHAGVYPQAMDGRY